MRCSAPFRKSSGSAVRTGNSRSAGTVFKVPAILNCCWTSYPAAWKSAIPSAPVSVYKREQVLLIINILRSCWGRLLTWSTNTSNCELKLKIHSMCSFSWTSWYPNFYGLRLSEEYEIFSRLLSTNTSTSSISYIGMLSNSFFIIYS